MVLLASRGRVGCFVAAWESEGRPLLVRPLVRSACVAGPHVHRAAETLPGQDDTSCNYEYGSRTDSIFLII